MDYFNTVIFENIADFDFTAQLGAMYGGQEFPVLAGGRLNCPADLGKHLAQALAKQMFLRKDKSAKTFDPNDTTGGLGAVLWNDQTLADLAAKMISNPIMAPKPAVLTEAQQTKAKVEELNKIEPEISLEGYKDKGQIMDELRKKGVQFDARRSKAELEKMLV